MILQIIQIDPVHNLLSDVASNLCERLLVFQIFHYVGKHGKGATVKWAFPKSLRDAGFSWNVKSVGFDGSHSTENPNGIRANLYKTLIFTFLSLNYL